jgi:VanZ family protein
MLLFVGIHVIAYNAKTVAGADRLVLPESLTYVVFMLGTACFFLYGGWKVHLLFLAVFCFYIFHAYWMPVYDKRSGPFIVNLSKQSINLFRLALVLAFVAITYLATTGIDLKTSGNVTDKIGHLMAFYMLAFILDFSFPRMQFDVRKIVILFVYGLMLEMIQYYLPYRTFSLFDLGSDGAGILLYLMSMPLLKRFRYLKQRWE